MAEAQSTSWEINVCSDDVGDILARIIEDSKNRSKVQSIEIESELKKVIKTKDALEQKYNKRKAIQDKVKDRVERRRAEWLKADMAYNSAMSKTRGIGRKLSVVSESCRKLNNALGQEKLFLEKFDDVYDEEGFVNRSFMILSIRDAICPDTPISFTHDQERKSMRLSWTTQDIRVSISGREVDANFGSFKVVVGFSYRDGVRDASVTVSPHRNNRFVGDYMHPHIERHGRACLGNVSRMVIEHMANQDVAQTIYTITEYLRHYNKNDPYRQLLYWADNSEDMRECVLFPENESTSYPYLNETHEETNPCGLSPSMCMVSHTMDSDGKCRPRGVETTHMENLNGNLSNLLEVITNGQSNR